MKIIQLVAENFKRLSVVQINPEGHLIQICGSNAAGKSSCLDAIWAALGGKDAAPEKPIRNGRKSARIEVKIGDGSVRYIVERTFTDKDSYLKVTDAEGSKHASPQRILDGLMGAIGFDPLAFMRMEPKKQFEMLRGLVKLDVDLDALDRRKATIYEERTLTNRLLERAKSVAASITVPDDLPDEYPDMKAITDRLAGVDAHNESVRELLREIEDVQDEAAAAEAIEAEFLAALEKAKIAYEEAKLQSCRCRENVEAAKLQHIPHLLDSDAIRAELDAASRVTAALSQRAAKVEAEAQATALQRESDEKTAAIKEIEEKKTAAITSAKMPVEGLALADGIVSFNGLPLAQASSAEQLRVSASIGAALNPKLRVLLARDGSLLDSKSLAALSEFAEKGDMQVWLEKVDESGEVGVVLVDGHVKGQEEQVQAFEAAQSNEKGKSEVDPARLKRATDYLDEQLALLPKAVIADADKLNAEVKVRLQHFPDLVATKWVPVYLARMKELSRKGAHA